MISFDVKHETSSSSSLGIVSSKEDAPTLSFSELLKGVSSKKDGKVIQNGALVLSLASDEKDVKSTKTVGKSNALLALLKNESTKKDEPLDIEPVEKAAEPVELNPKITAKLTTQEVKTLVSDAKEYLKSKILQSDGYKKLEIKDLPKTLKGLADLAKKVGVDVSKITLEEVQLKTSTDVGVTKAVQSSKVEVSDAKAEVSVAKAEVSVAKAEVKKDKISEKFEEVTPLKVDDKKVEGAKEIKSTPLFKAQVNLEHTTEQLVQTKQFKTEEKTPKTRADETLKLLLMGERPSQNSLSLTADFSVATAKVIAPSATTDATKALSKLLHSEDKESVTASKTDGLSTLKADSFEVKLNEAKHMIKYLSADVKTAIEDYKSPFTRVKIQLNPQKLGEVDLTIVQRGKNLHVNLSSNSVAINTLAMNATELKTQLSNSGINNATLNFSNSSENSGSNQHQGQREHEKQAHEQYNYFDKETENEEIVSSLEIVIPRYI
jgi:hypothetical protein